MSSRMTEELLRPLLIPRSSDETQIVDNRTEIKTHTRYDSNRAPCRALHAELRSPAKRF